MKGCKLPEFWTLKDTVIPRARIWRGESAVSRNAGEADPPRFARGMTVSNMIPCSFRARCPAAMPLFVSEKQSHTARDERRGTRYCEHRCQFGTNCKTCRYVASSRRAYASICSMKYRVLFEQNEDGILVATCPALPGCISQGHTRAEAQANIRSNRRLPEEPAKTWGACPPGIEEEVVDIAVRRSYP